MLTKEDVERLNRERTATFVFNVKAFEAKADKEISRAILNGDPSVSISLSEPNFATDVAIEVSRKYLKEFPHWHWQISSNWAIVTFNGESK